MAFTSAQKKLIMLSSLGGALEFYDFIIFIFFAKILSEVFLPNQTPFIALMATFTIFALGYLVRPLGGIIFGHFGDKFGRKKTFISTVFLMAAPTLAMGLLPTYQHIGLSAAILLLLLRIIQGLAVGGEIPGSIVYVVETAPTNRRGLACGIIFFGFNFGMLLASGTGSAISSLLSPQQLTSWGWRIPFIFGGLLGLISFYLRRALHETTIFQAMIQQNQQESLPIHTLIKYFPKQIFQGMLLCCAGTVLVGICLLYMPTYLQKEFEYPQAIAMQLNTLGILLFSIRACLMGFCSDYLGRKKVMAIGIILLLIASYPTFLLLYHQSAAAAIAVHIIFALIGGCITGIFPCLLAELYPTTVRYSGFAVSYNLSYAIFGGLTPVIITWLLHKTQNPIAPAFYLIFAAFITSLALWKFKETQDLV